MKAPSVEKTNQQLTFIQKQRKKMIDLGPENILDV